MVVTVYTSRSGIISISGTRSNHQRTLQMNLHCWDRKLFKHFHTEHNPEHGHRGKTSFSKQQVPTAAKAKRRRVKLRFLVLHWRHSEYFHFKQADKTKCESCVKNTLDPLELLWKRHLPLLKCIQWSTPNRPSLLLCRVRSLFPMERSAALSRAASRAIALELNWTNIRWRPQHGSSGILASVEDALRQYFYFEWSCSHGQ